jgi:hypothetical protein
MNTHFPFFTSDCARISPLLPLLNAAGALNADEAAAAQVHLKTCPRCQRHLREYAIVEEALRAQQAAGASSRNLTLAEVIHLVDQEPEDAPAPPPAPVWPRPPRIRRFVANLAPVAAVLVIIVVVTALMVSRVLPQQSGMPYPVASSPTPTGELNATPGGPPIIPGLTALQMLSPTEGWAVGAAIVAPSGAQPSSERVLILHYHDGQWKNVPAPSNAQLGLPGAGLNGIAMLSAEEGWAVGSSSSSNGALPSAFMLHYRNGMWTRYGGLMRNAVFTRVQMLSPTDGWIGGSSGGFGTVASPETSFLLHYDGIRWSPVQAPPVVAFGTLEMLSATDGWATGQDKILHYDGQRWTSFQDVPQVEALSMVSASSGWAVGYSFVEAELVFWHYNGQQWVQSASLTSGSKPYDPSPIPVVLALSMDSATDGWAVGVQSPDSSLVGTALYLHYSQGHWTKAVGPPEGYLTSVTMLSADEGWAVGGGGVVLHYHHGAWSPYQF